MSFVLFNRCQLSFNNTVEKQVLFIIFKIHIRPVQPQTDNILICLLLRIVSFLAFYVVIFIKSLKDCTGSILKVFIISLYLLIPYFYLIQLCIYSHRTSLSGDIEKIQDGSEILINVSQCVPGNLISVTSHNFSKIQS